MIRIPGGSWIANALETSDVVLAVRVVTARRFAARRFNRWHAKKIRISNKVRIADAFICLRIAARANSTNYALASSLTPSANANTGLSTRNFRRTDVRNTLATRERISHEPFDAFASGTIIRNNALGASSADKAVALRNTLIVASLGESHDTSAPRNVFVWLTIGIGTTRDVIARINAAPLDTS